METGAAYAYRFDGVSWVEEQKLVAMIPFDESRYGRACAIDGFEGGAVGCETALDVNDDDALDLSDPISLLEFIFNGGPAPFAPYPGCDEEPVAGPIGCVGFDCP